MRILVTRARAQASDLSEKLESLGASPIVLPSIEFEFLEGEPLEEFDNALRKADTFDAVVFTSARGVEALRRRLIELDSNTAKSLASRQLVAVGSVTAAALAEAVREPDLVPTNFSASGILAALGEVSGRRFLLLRADQAKDDLPSGLMAAGAVVDDVVAYRIVKSPETGEEALAGPPPDIITFTSSSGVLNTHERLVRAGLEDWFEQSPIVCIGPVTANTVLELGYKVTATSREATMAGLVEAIVEIRQAMEMSHA